MSEYERIGFVPNRTDFSQPGPRKETLLPKNNQPEAAIQSIRLHPQSLQVAHVMQLQKAIGNQAVGQLMQEIMKARPVSRKPVTGLITPAARVMQSQQDENQRLSPAANLATVQRQVIPEEEEEPLQMKRSNTTGIPDHLKLGIESLSGIDMTDVRVHYNSDKPVGLGALAYTQGTEIHVAPGQEKHLPHEMWHVVQQAQGRVQPTMQKKGLAVNDEVDLEREADEIGKMIR